MRREYMIVRGRLLGLSLLLSILCFSLSVYAEPSLSQSQARLLARRAAEADCYRKLAETVYGIQIDSETYVRDFVAESDEIRSEVDTFITGVRLGTPRYFDDGTCEIDAELSVARLVGKLEEVHSVHYRGRSLTIVDIERIDDRMETKIIRVTGSGAPRATLPPELPIGTEAAITPLPIDFRVASAMPAIWRAAGGQARLLAERAAEIDATRKLLERIQGLRLTSSTLVRDFITETDEIRTRARGLVRGAAVASKYLHADELIVEVTMEIPIETVITRVHELHSEYYRHGRVTASDITNIKKKVRREMIRATGTGLPPPRLLRGSARGGTESPAWIADRIRASGEATDPRIATAQGRLRAHRAARVVAMRNLLERILDLPISAEAHIQDVFGDRKATRLRVSGVVSGAVETDVEFMDDGVRVTVSLPGSELWLVVREQMSIVQRRR